MTLDKGYIAVTALTAFAAVLLAGCAGAGEQPPIVPAERAKIDKTRMRIITVERGLEHYNLHIGRYPTEDEGGLQALRTKPAFDNEADSDKWAGPYLAREPTDAWGRPLEYELMDPDAAGKEPARAFRVWSLGPDGVSGTDDDITSWSEDEEK